MVPMFGDFRLKTGICAKVLVDGLGIKGRLVYQESGING